MLPPEKIAELLSPYISPFENAPRGAFSAIRYDLGDQTAAHVQPNAPRGAIHHADSQIAPRGRIENAPRGTITPDLRLLDSLSPTGTQNAPRGTTANNENAPRGTLQKPDWPVLYEKLATYLDLLLRWNARTNLTAIRDPEQIIQRHFGESLFTGLLLEQMLHVEHSATLLDYGSGAGFPGLPIHLLYPTLHVTLAESQGKKAAFLREAVRHLGTTTEVWSQRVEAMPPSRRFDLVTLRAVDDMEAALRGASERATSGLAILTTRSALGSTFQIETVALPRTADGIVALARR